VKRENNEALRLAMEMVRKKAAPVNTASRMFDVSKTTLRKALAVVSQTDNVVNVVKNAKKYTVDVKNVFSQDIQQGPTGKP